MRKYLLWLLAILPFLTTSCIKDESETELDDYCYISSVTLGGMRRNLKLSNGTSVSTAYSGSAFGMTVDHRTLTIENRDSLLFGTDLRAVAMTIAYQGAALAYRTAGSDDAWKQYNTKDSMDLRTPIELSLLADDGKSSRLYTLKLNVHQLDGDSIRWQKAEAMDVLGTDPVDEMKAVVVEGRLSVLARMTGNVVLAKRSGLNTVGEWENVATDLPADADFETLCQQGDALYISTADGKIYTSMDAEQWTLFGEAKEGLKLAGVSGNRFYALAEGKLYAAENAIGWAEEALDDDAVRLPATSVSILKMQQPNGNERLVMVGIRNNEADTTAVVWNKMWDATTDEASAEWVYFNQTWENKQLLPRLRNMNLLQYDGRCLAFGGASSTGRREAMDAAYVSNDYGITWRKDSDLTIPQELKGTQAPVASAVDKDNVIWIISGNQVWRGRLNKLGFERR